MREQISVDKAIKRGHLIVNVPVFLFIIGCPSLAFYLLKQNLIPVWGMVIAIPIGFILAWFIWSFMITKWRIWAFENVRNVNELKKRAIQEKLIWNDRSIFEKTEIRTHEDNEQLKNLEKKFEIEDEYKEDYSLPIKTEIYYSKAYNYVEIGSCILVISVGIYCFTSGEIKQYVLGAIMTGIGLCGAIKESRKAISNKPQIIIDTKGIQTIKVGFTKWSDILNEEVIQEGFASSAKSYLTYYYDEEGFEKVEIDSLNVTHRALENILRTYRIRNNKNGPKSS